MSSPLDRRPIVVALAGPNGAGKTTFYQAFLRSSGLYFVSADVLSEELHVDAYTAAETAGRIREGLIAHRESFIFETVFSDPVGEKLKFLEEAERLGYTAILFFIGIDSPELSDQRVAMRVSQGGHDVPLEKLNARFPRILCNLRNATIRLSNVYIYDNSDLADPYRLVAQREDKSPLKLFGDTPGWLEPLITSV